MAALLYYLILKPISWLPYPLLYGLSDILCVLLYRVLGYRKEVVRTNLVNSFPEKSPEEIQATERKFYHHLCDLMVESIKAFSISEKQLLKRAKIRNPELLQPYFDQGRSVVIASSHYNSWEMAGTASDRQLAHQSIGIYAPIKQPFFDKKAKASRSKFGLIMIPIKSLKDFFEAYQGPPTATLFATDQSPRKVETAYWTTFLNQDTGVMRGSEVYAKKHDWPIFWARIHKVKRGHYESSFELITDRPRDWAEGEIIETYTRMLEADIRAEPAYWLWSHKRWKRKRPANLHPAS
ncbi:MAG: lysophospholipid acyltransferase family protein [Bacteroidota bacterium]